MTTERERGRSLNPPFHLFIYLFKTNLIGLNYLLSYFMSGQKDIFVFGTIPVFGTQTPLRNIKLRLTVDVDNSAHVYVYEMISLLIRL